MGCIPGLHICLGHVLINSSEGHNGSGNPRNFIDHHFEIYKLKKAHRTHLAPQIHQLMHIGQGVCNWKVTFITQESGYMHSENQ